VYLASSAIAAYCVWHFAANDMTLATLAAGVTVVGLGILLLLSLGIAMSVFFNNTIFAVVGMLLLWYVASPIFSFVGAQYLSPTSLVRNLPRILKDPDAPLLLQCTATGTSLTLTFSKDLDAARAEDPAGYLLEGENGTNYVARTAVYDRPHTSVILSGLDLPAGGTLKVTVRNVTDAGGSAISPAADSTTVMIPATASSPTVSRTEPLHASTAISSAAALPGSAAHPAVAPAQAGPPHTGVSPARAAGHAAPRVSQCTATVSSVKVNFSEEMDPADAETVGNFIIENPPGRTVPALAAVYSPGTRSVLLSGLKLSLEDPIKVTVKNARSNFGDPIASRANSAVYSAVTVWKYVLGFGVPTLIVSMLCVVCFSRRDM
jgi:hypothetical protein